MQSRFIIFLILLIHSSALIAVTPNPNDSLLRPISSRSFQLTPSIIDSLIKELAPKHSKFTTDTSKLNIFNFAQDSVPNYPVSVYRKRLADLNSRTPIQLTYNEATHSFIELYTHRRRNLSSRMLGLAQLYYPMFEESLDRYDLPLELKHLSIIESALNPLAKSKSGAVGLWQFLLNSGKMFDLEVNSYVDERRDPIKSTEAACKYFEYLYRIFNDWELVLAAYNGGPGEVRNAIERSGGKTNYWDIRPFLPKQTQGYVPAFTAVNYMMNYASEHNIYPTSPKISYSQTDTVKISHPVYFEQISKEIGISVKYLASLNPAYKRNYIPITNQSEVLILPQDKIAQFIKKEKVIYKHHKTKNYHDLCANPGSKKNSVKVTHIVQQGEFLHKLAINYGCTIEDIIKWNKLNSKELNINQLLEIWVDKTHAYRFKQNVERKQFSLTINQIHLLHCSARRFAMEHCQ